MDFKYRHKPNIMTRDDFLFDFMSHFSPQSTKNDYPYFTACSLHDVPFNITETKTAFWGEILFANQKRRFNNALELGEWLYDSIMTHEVIAKIEKTYKALCDY